MKAVRVILKSIFAVIMAAALSAAAYACYVLATYYRIDDNLDLTIYGTAAAPAVSTGTAYRVSSANMGFGAYSADYTFFMDGGVESRARSAEAARENIAGQLGYVLSLQPDFLLFQEVDIDGTRSRHVDEAKIIRDTAEADGSYVYTFAVNYDSPYLLYPFREPHGKNRSGLLTFSSAAVTSGLRRSLPVADSLYKILDLDRCYTTQRIPVENGRELVLYNVHLSAYGTSDSLSRSQIRKLAADMQAEYEKGNYAVAGGDMNKDLLGNSWAVFGTKKTDDDWAAPFPTDELPGGFALIAPTGEAGPVPSARNNDEPYVQGRTFVLTLDGFIVSPNVEVLQAHVFDGAFRYSDHNPVYMDFALKQDAVAR